MTRYALFSILIGFNFIIQASAQRIDNSSVFKTIGSDSYFRFHYDNDYFTRTDCYYTQGIELEYVNPFLKNFPLSKLMVKPRQSEIKFGISIDHSAYTPTSTSSDEILYGDRPFAACLSLRTFTIATDSSRHQRVSTALVTGIIGPSAGGREMQTTIHRWLDNPKPRGWQYQIQNDVILNYQVNYEKELLNVRNMLLLNDASEIRMGTLNDRINGALNIMIGKVSDPYQSASNARKWKKKFSYYLYGQPGLNLIGYDASLQGGFFDRKSLYTIPAAEISRITFQCDYGIVVVIHTLYLEYCQSYITKEFNTGKYHRWGGIRVAFAL